MGKCYVSSIKYDALIGASRDTMFYTLLSKLVGVRISHFKLFTFTGIKWSFLLSPTELVTKCFSTGNPKYQIVVVKFCSDTGRSILFHVLTVGAYDIIVSLRCV